MMTFSHPTLVKKQNKVSMINDKCYDACTSDKCCVYHVFVSFMYRVGL